MNYIVPRGTARGRATVTITSANLSLRIADVDLPVEYAGAQNEFPGLDQVNVRLPGSLPRHTDPLFMQLSVDGKLAAGGQIAFK